MNTSSSYDIDTWLHFTRIEFNHIQLIFLLFRFEYVLWKTTTHWIVIAQIFCLIRDYHLVYMCIVSRLENDHWSTILTLYLFVFLNKNAIFVQCRTHLYMKSIGISSSSFTTIWTIVISLSLWYLVYMDFSWNDFYCLYIIHTSHKCLVLNAFCTGR